MYIYIYICIYIYYMHIHVNPFFIFCFFTLARGQLRTKPQARALVRHPSVRRSSGS